MSLYRCDNRTSAGQLGASVAVYATHWIAALSLCWFDDHLALLFALPIGLLKVRLFNIQHDCAHGSYFSRPKANAVTGSLLGLATFTPFHYWRRHHLLHHATNGDLDRRGHGDITMWTADEFVHAGFLKQVFYRAYRNPAVFLIVGPFFYFFVKMRIPHIAPKGSRERNGIVALNVALLFVWLGIALLSPHPTLVAALLLTSLFIAGSVGIWLFFVQHQFEDAQWRRSTEWSYKELALQGSSHLLLPDFFEWLFVRINLHHFHHYDPLIPNYLLRRVMEEERMPSAHPVALREGLRVFRLKVWDEKERKLMPFPRRAGAA